MIIPGELLWVECPVCKGFANFRWTTPHIITLSCECQSMKTAISHVECIRCKKLLGYCRETSGAIAVEPCACQDKPQMFLKPIKPKEPDPTNCWYKPDANAPWGIGFFHQWSINYEEFETGPGNYPVAIIEDAVDSQVHVVYAGHVSFSPDGPDDPAPEPNEALDKAAKEYEAVMAAKRLLPRIVSMGGRLAVQIERKTIDIFDASHRHICKVNWVDGKLDSSPGWFSVETLEAMFREVNG